MAEPSIGNRAARGAIWNIGASVGSRVIGVVGTLYMTRLLLPDVIGEVSAAAVLAQTGNWISHWGFNQYMVVKGLDDDERTYHVAVVNFVFAVIGLGLIACTSRIFAPILSTPNLAAFLPGLALAVFIRRVGGLADKVLVRDLRFREVALASAAGELAFSVSAVGLAATTKLGGQAIVIGNIVQSVVVTGLVFKATGLGWLKRSPWSWARVREIMDFGVPLGVAQVLNAASRYWDNLAFSAFFGRRVLGLYNMAYNLADIPAVQFGEQIGGVLLPAMQKVPEADRKRAVVHASALLAVVVFPMAIGLGAVSKSLIAVLLKPDWQGVAPLLAVLSALSVFRPLTWVLASYVGAYGRNKALMILEAFKLVLLLGCIAVFAKFGPLWSSGAVGVAFAAHALALCVLVVKVDGIPGGELFGGFIRPLIASLVMGAAVLGIRHVLVTHGVQSRYGLLASEIVVGALVYVPMIWLVANETSQEFVGRVRKALRRDK